MKNNIGHIFVDDGYPEAEEYETNYVSYDMKDPGSYHRAMETANRMRPASRLSDTLTFRSIPLDSYSEKQMPRRYPRRRLRMKTSLIRDKLIRWIHQ
jgi:hypothetical protein